MNPSLNQSVSCPKKALQGSSLPNPEGSLTSRAQLLVAGGNTLSQSAFANASKWLTHKSNSSNTLLETSLAQIRLEIRNCRDFQGLSGFGIFSPEPFGSLRHPVLT